MGAGSPVRDRALWVVAAIALTLIAGGLFAARAAHAGTTIATASPVVSSTAVSLGDTVQLGEPALASPAGLSSASYVWNFGDGSLGEGPQVEHTYRNPGRYTATLTVTSPGGVQTSVSQAILVHPGARLPMRADMVGAHEPGAANDAGLTVRLQLLPQALRRVLNRGMALQVSSTAPANGFATILLARKFARLARIRAQRRPWVVIGTGTLWQVKAGTETLHLHLASSVVRKLRHLSSVGLTVKLLLVDARGRRVAVSAAGDY